MGKGKGGSKTKEEAVAEAWQKAKDEVDEKKRKQWEERRGSRSNQNPMEAPRAGVLGKHVWGVQLEQRVRRRNSGCAPEGKEWASLHGGVPHEGKNGKGCSIVLSVAAAC